MAQVNVKRCNRIRRKSVRGVSRARLIMDCLDRGAPLDEYRERVMDILIDRESILPKVHFIGEKMISLIEEDPETRPEDMIDLCNNPEN